MAAGPLSVELGLGLDINWHGKASFRVVNSSVQEPDAHFLLHVHLLQYLYEFVKGN